MSDPHANEIIEGGQHGLDDHAEAPSHEQDDDAHADQPLGPIDWPAYGAGALGVVIGVAMATVFAAAVGAI